MGNKLPVSSGQLQVERLTSITKCCIGSRAAFISLLSDRQSLSDEALRQIIGRLNQVIELEKRHGFQ